MNLTWSHALARRLFTGVFQMLSFGARRLTGIEGMTIPATASGSKLFNWSSLWAKTSTGINPPCLWASACESVGGGFKRGLEKYEGMKGGFAARNSARQFFDSSSIKILRPTFSQSFSGTLENASGCAAGRCWKTKSSKTYRKRSIVLFQYSSLTPF